MDGMAQRRRAGIGVGVGVGVKQQAAMYDPSLITPFAVSSSSSHDDTNRTHILLSLHRMARGRLISHSVSLHDALALDGPVARRDPGPSCNIVCRVAGLAMRDGRTMLAAPLLLSPPLSSTMMLTATSMPVMDGCPCLLLLLPRRLFVVISDQ